jgi:hypothetical protein
MPNVGDIETKFGRKYMFLNPDPLVGPGTWRLSAADGIPGSGGSGGGPGGIQDIDGVLPIVANQDVTGATEISMDITKLDNREAP